MSEITAKQVIVVLRPNLESADVGLVILGNKVLTKSTEQIKHMCDSALMYVRIVNSQVNLS